MAACAPPTVAMIASENKQTPANAFNIPKYSPDSSGTNPRRPERMLPAAGDWHQEQCQ
jgi:hypothetical protein